MPWALFYPADYSIGSANLGFHYVFQTLRRLGAAAERFFAAPFPYRSVDFDTMLERFSVITASIAYEGDIPVFYKWLADGGVPLSPAARENGAFPVVGVGGALTYINPLAASGVCDFIILGDGLDALPHVADCLRRYERGACTRRGLWENLAENPNVFVPPLDVADGGLARPLAVSRTLDLNGAYPMHSAWMTPRGAFGKSLLLELQRGCARSCSYCTLPRCFGRMRFREYEIIKNALDEITGRFDVPQAGLVTPEAGDYPFLPRLIDDLLDKNIGVSFASLRLDRLNKKMIEALAGSGRKSITVAPETGGEELRFACGKKFTDDLIIEKLSLAKELGIDKVKMYFMIGLPGETDEDITKMTELCRRAIAETGQNLTLSVNPFIPKPGTPWEGEIFAGKQTIRQKYEKIKKEMRTIGKRMPQLRLTGIKEAETEFNLAWYGFAESAALAENIENDVFALPQSERTRTMDELSRFS